MSSFKVVRGTTTSRVFAVLALAGIAILAAMPSWGEPATQRKMVELFTLLALAQMWNLLAGFAGVVSVGQQAFMGLGAYAMIFLVNVHGKDLYYSVPISALIVAVLAIPMGLVAFRLRGSYFAIGTWVLAEVASKVIITRKSLGAGDGVSLKVSGHSVASRQDVTYWFAMGTGIGAVLLAYLVLRSRLGLQMQAIRDDESGARGLGVNVYRTRFVIWILAALWTGLPQRRTTSSSCEFSRSEQAVRSASCCGRLRSSSSSSSAVSERSRVRSSEPCCTTSCATGSKITRPSI